MIAQNSEKEDGAFKWFAGVFVLSAKDVESLFEKKKEIDITGYGVLIINDDVDSEKLFRTVKSIKVKGKLDCSAAIKEHYNVKRKR